MGATSHLLPNSFARHINDYLWHLVEPLGADKSGRWLEEKTNGERKKDYWHSVISNKKAMTMNDIQLIAETFEMSPYQFIRNARDWDGLADDDDKPIAPVIDGGFGKNIEPAEARPEAAASPFTEDRGEDGEYD